MQKQLELGVMIKTAPYPMLVVKLEGEDRLRVLTVLHEEDIDTSQVASWISKGGVESVGEKNEG